MTKILKRYHTYQILARFAERFIVPWNYPSINIGWRLLNIPFLKVNKWTKKEALK
jgi:hypothetical protein